MTAPTLSSLTPEKDLLVNGIRVNEIVKAFESLGYQCEVNTKLKGTSGTEHPFDIVSRKDSEIVVVDIVTFRASILDTPASDAQVLERLQMAGIQIRAKAWDCGTYQSVIIYLSSYFTNSDNSVLTGKYDPFELFLKQNNIKIVRSTDVRGAAKKLRAHLASVESDPHTTV